MTRWIYSFQNEVDPQVKIRNIILAVTQTKLCIGLIVIFVLPVPKNISRFRIRPLDLLSLRALYRSRHQRFYGEWLAISFRSEFLVID